MKHLVYLIKFKDREKRKEYPCYYIGSKSNCTYSSGRILNKEGKVYTGSSKCEEYIRCIERGNFVVEPLKWFSEYDECLSYERFLHEVNDVVANHKFFNKALAQENPFHNPDYSNYRNVITGSIARLPKTHEGVVSGEWVGATKGCHWYNDGKQQKVFLEGEQPSDWVIGRLDSYKKFGEENHFYGRSHSEESICKIKESKLKWKRQNPEKFEEVRRKASERAKKTFKGVPKSEEHKGKIGRSGLIMLQNSVTGECIRIPKNERDLYDENLWMNPYKLKMLNAPKITCPFCGKTGKESNSFRRWHFDNCKHKEQS